MMHINDVFPVSLLVCFETNRFTDYVLLLIKIRAVGASSGLMYFVTHEEQLISTHWLLLFIQEITR